MANERVSQLLELYANGLASEDLFLITDMSERESKKLGLGQLMSYIENSGSFQAWSATNADTASFVLGSNVFGAVTSASYSDKSHLSDSASYATFAPNAGQAISASYASVAQTLLGGSSTVSASHALRSDWADNAQNVAFLYYSGVNNGTASAALTCSYADNLQIWYPGGTPGSLGHGITICESVNDGVWMIMSGSLDGGEFFIRTFDNGTEPVRFQGYNYAGPPYTIDRAILTGTTNLNEAKWTVYGDMSASAYTSSKASGVGFFGTSSHALTSSYTEFVAGGSIKAWAFVTWSAAHVSSCSLYKSRNFTSVQYITSSQPNVANTIDYFGLVFSTPMVDDSYMVIGNAIGYVSNWLGVPVDAVLTQNPRAVNWDTTGCTMSIWITSSMRSLFYGGATQANLQVLG